MKNKLFMMKYFTLEDKISFITKIFSIFYLIPLFAIIGEEGGILYSYTYTVYFLFITMFTSEIGIIISKYKDSYDKRLYKFLKKISYLVGVVEFTIIFFMAPLVSKLLNLDITLLIRVLSISLLLVPVITIYKGYLMDYFRRISIIEKLSRLLIIVFGSLISKCVFHLSIKYVVLVALCGILCSNILVYIYCVIASKRLVIEKKQFKYNNLLVLKKLFFYALPFIFINLYIAIYNLVDVFTVSKTVSLMKSYSIIDSYKIINSMMLWGSIFSYLIIYIAFKFVLKVFNTINKKSSDISEKVNKYIKTYLVIGIPITVFMSMLSKALWMLFYGNTYGSYVLSVYVFQILFMGLYFIFLSVVVVLRQYKVAIISLLSGIILKGLLNVSLMNSFNKMGLPPYYGSIFISICSTLIALIMCLYMLKRRYLVSYLDTFKVLFNLFLSTLVMVIVIILFKFIVSSFSYTRLFNVVILLGYLFVSFISYFIILYKSKTISKLM